MEEIFKSLSESVSEQCYDDILSIIEEIISEMEDSTIENALKKASDNVESSTYGLFTPSKNAVEKYGKLQELAKRRAARQGKEIEVKGDEFGYKFKHVPKKVEDAKK